MSKVVIVLGGVVAVVELLGLLLCWVIMADDPAGQANSVEAAGTVDTATQLLMALPVTSDYCFCCTEQSSRTPEKLI